MTSSEDFADWLVFQIRFEGMENSYVTASVPIPNQASVQFSLDLIRKSKVLERRVEQLFGWMSQYRGRKWECIGYVAMKDDLHRQLYPQENAELSKPESRE